MSNRRPSSQTKAGQVDNYLGTSFDIVKAVHDELPEIKEVRDNLPELLELSESLQDEQDGLGAIINNLEEILESDDNAAKAKLEADRAEAAADSVNDSIIQIEANRLDILDNATESASIRAIEVGVGTNNGLKNGGNLSADRPLAVDITGTQFKTLVAPIDKVLVEDGAGLKSVDVQSLVNAGTRYEIRGTVTIDAGANTATLHDTLTTGFGEVLIDEDGFVGVDPGIPDGAVYLADAAALNSSITGTPKDWSQGDPMLYVSSATNPWGRLDDGVESFNGRAGIVVPEKADYSTWFPSHDDDETITGKWNHTGEVVVVDAANAQNPVTKTQWDTKNTTQDSAIASNTAAVSDLAWWLHVPSENDLNTMRQQNNETYDASGFVHYGKHFVVASEWLGVNEGLSAINETTTNTGNSNLVIMGSEGANANGTSLTDFARTVIAGYVSDVVSLNSTIHSVSNIKFPQAPDGTVIYDSTGDCRGTGNANLDLTIDVDPKYGDVAADTNEAVARAFEGHSRNGDFRNGVIEWQSRGGSSLVVTDGNMLVENGTTSQGALRGQCTSLVVGESYTLNVQLISSDSSPYLSITGIGGVSISGEGLHSFSFTATNALHEVYLATGDATIGTSFNCSSVYVSKVTEEVVTERVDMFGGEFFLEQITEAQPFVYANGMIQSQATSINGVSTVLDNRPLTYSAVYDGDESSQGRGVDFINATDAQKAQILAAEGINIYRMNNGDLVQWRMAQLTKSGDGNGDWFNVNPTNGALEYADGTPVLSRQGFAFVKDEENQGIFTDSNGNYFHVWGTVPRLNQGAYHPSFNKSGTAFSRRESDGVRKRWYDSDVDTHTSTLTTFTRKCIQLGGRGAIEDGASGRDDSHLYDAIYADGLGGVVDYRLSAWDMSSAEEAAKIKEKVKNGTYRGLETPTYTQIKGFTVESGITDYGRLYCTALRELVGETGGKNNSKRWLLYNPSTGHYAGISNVMDSNNIWVSGNHTGTNDTGIATTNDITFAENLIRYWSCNIDTENMDLSTPYYDSCGNNPSADTAVGFPIGSTFYAIEMSSTNTSVSGNFTMQDVIGDPANILLTPDLQNGWYGSWIPEIPEIPDGTSKEFPFTRKNLRTDFDYIISDDNGVTWRIGTIGMNNATNSYTATERLGRVSLWSYTAFAKQTVEDENRPILNGSEGVGDVFQYCWNSINNGVLLAEGLLGKVITNGNADMGLYNDLVLQSYGLTPNDGKMQPSANYIPKHNPLLLQAPTNNSPAVKTLISQTATNGLCSLQFQANELTWDATKDSRSDAVPVASTDTVINTSVGELYSITNTSNNSVVVVRALITTSTRFRYLSPYRDYWLDEQGVKVFENWDGSGWGDDSTVKITATGSDTFDDLNGNTNIQTVHKLALDYGYSKNQARAGTQVEGVDL